MREPSDPSTGWVNSKRHHPVSSLNSGKNRPNPYIKGGFSTKTRIPELFILRNQLIFTDSGPGPALCLRRTSKNDA